MDDSVFFADEKNKAVIQNLSNQITGLIAKANEANKADFLLRFVGVALFNMGAFPAEYDERCRFNVEYIGEQLIQLIKGFRNESGEDIQRLFSCCYRFVIEFQAGSPEQLPSELLTAVHQVHDNEEFYSLDTVMTIRYAEHQMLMQVLKRYVYHPNMSDLQGLNKSLKEAAQQKTEISSELDERQRRVEILKASLDKYETAFNFVGLYDGFKQLRLTKHSEKNLNFVSLLLLGVLMIAPFLLKFYMSFYPIKDVSLDSGFYIGLVGFELLLAYFFRVALHNFRSVKAQLLQIDLRMTLCQFVQSYVGYAKDVKQGSPELLEKFEQIVFSGIVNSEGAIPSTFDGIEQIANIIEKLKSK